MDKETRTLVGTAVGALGSVVVAALLVSVRGDVRSVNVALVLVLFVLLGATIGGRAAGVASAVVAALSFDFFHTVPYNSLKIANSDDLQTTVLLLIVGVAVGAVAARSDRFRAATTDRRDDLARVHRIAHSAAAGEQIEDLVAAVRAELADTLRLQVCIFERPPFVAPLPQMGAGGKINGGPHHRYTHEGFELPREGVELLVVASGQTFGRFILVPTPGAGVSVERRLVAVTLADQLGLAISQATASGRS